MSSGAPERIDPEAVVPGIAAHHMAKYEFAGGFVGAGPVLDVGCGIGYGTAMLAARERACFGIDVDSVPLETAMGRYGGLGVSFAVMDAQSLAFRNAQFGLVVCFEAIEHFVDPTAHLKEVSRVLMSHGTYVMSTPQPGQGGHPSLNPHHLHEFSAEHLRNILRPHFRHVTLFGQRRLQSSAHRALQSADRMGLRKLSILRPIARFASRALRTAPTEDAEIKDFVIDKRGAESGSEYVVVCRP